MELTPLDYEILEFVSRFDHIEKTEIINYFSSKIESVEYRIELLARQEYHTRSRAARIPLPNTSYIMEEYVTDEDDNGISHSESTGFFHITDKGKTALQDHKIKIQSEITKNRKDTILRILPIVIALIALLKSFWPDITSIWRQLTQLLK